jgi:hypothetical protein
MLAGPLWLEWGLVVGALLFPIGLLGLYGLLNGGGGRLATAGLLLAAFFFVTLVLLGLGWLLLPDDMQPQEEEFVFPMSLGFVVAFLALLGSGMALGLAVWRAKALPTGWRALPLALVVLPFPLIGVGAVLQTVDERLEEIPIVLLGIGWVTLGYVIWSSASMKATHPSQDS